MRLDKYMWHQLCQVHATKNATMPRRVRGLGISRSTDLFEASRIASIIKLGQHDNGIPSIKGSELATWLYSHDPSAQMAMLVKK